MFRRFAAILLILTSAALLSVVTIYASRNDVVKPINLTVHEWGTFTSVAGPDGKAAQWLPLAGPTDLPCFVNYFQNRLYKSIGPVVANTPRLNTQLNVDYNKARSELLGPIRMETPVLYFYSDKPQTVDVRVAFPKGFITEWYPPANVNQTAVRTGVLPSSANTGATIVWKNVEILPGIDNRKFPMEASPSHYYAARETDATPVRVLGKAEKFLFYRGVGGFPVPINVTVTESGKIHVKHLTGKPSVILFESRGGRLGYAVVDTSKDEAVLDSPELTGNFDALRKTLESELVREGLYAKEARAMVDTWRDSWFEEGTRLFYIVPPAMVDAILPLTVEPKPEQAARVFVGRVEVFTPATLNAVEKVVRSNDKEILTTYGRFLGPILERLPQSKRANTILDAAFKDYINQAASCIK
jgi:hypothetical protein